MGRTKALFVLALCFLCSCPGEEQPPAPAPGAGAKAMTVTSTAFREGEVIPKQYTADGKDLSPPLAWTGVPEGTKSLALICDDPDAPRGTWVHWVLWDLPPEAHKLPEGLPAQDTLPRGAKQGKNDFGKVGYNGPAPPRGSPHRYYFKLYALDVMLDLAPGATKKQLLEGMGSHLLAQGQLMGKYQR